MKSQTPNHLERTTLKPLAPVPRVIAVATILAAFITASPAIIVHNAERGCRRGALFFGTVTHVDQNRRTFALRFQGKGLNENGYYHPEETYRVTDTTAYKGGSWANVTKGAMVHVTGHSDVADTVEFTNTVTGEQTGSGTVAPGANVQNAATYNDRGLAKQRKGDLDGAMADYNHAIELDPQYAIAYNNRGNIKLAKGDLNGATADYNHPIEHR